MALGAVGADAMAADGTGPVAAADALLFAGACLIVEALPVTFGFGRVAVAAGAGFAAGALGAGV
ncbi:MAG: hypothetical protein ACRESY_12130, partial [Steroidobacteraceae bacterium]